MAISGLNSLSLLKVPFWVKHFPHCLAGEGLFSSMNSHVDIKVSFSVETSSTLLAGESILSSVNSHVFFLSFDVD